ncbi:hypothetical protein ECP030529314_3417 [Escherichia coli p0305293.14]|uniref:DUF262 domain-containing protein n=2 Tax=Escherichia coli TaxID=562 RepID=UPI0002C8A91E|nr:DUF262 domain-containing protein [Escherichia coli]EMZ85697.1 hypothetical protein ECP03052931_1878 [Escherichia coli p0305293.1]ENE08466.1 hypothetical protein ECP030529314_3417 [Escherichia coli p0305293.14]ENG37716.1 hypothetical protein ECP030529310_5308 [Escherichia coli p0305293.10]ENG47049.1 hypothetical protein ECP030529315_5020 [Escherichia coli p0305293.15]ENG48170.1 hypothetical protein ECP030529312_5277 [Escherichia coli p0305293.12]
MSIEQKYVSTCLQQKFNLPTYQRDYKWGAAQLQDLISDIQHTFMSEWRDNHGRENILSYKDYFLGCIIIAPSSDGGKVIIDGQQRITTLVLLLCYFHRYSLLHPDLDISPIDANIRRKLAGKNSFNLSVSDSREALFNVLMDDELDDIAFCSRVDSIPDKDAGTVKIWDQYQRINDLIDPDIISKGLIPHFVDYLTERVYLYQIIVKDESDGHRVFVTMNDRGLKLTPIDLLKGFLLSGVSVPERNSEAHEAWVSVVNKLNKISHDEASTFIKSLLRAKYAKTNRSRRADEEPKDFDVIASNYHRWVIDNKDKLGLKNSNDYHSFITGVFSFFADVYIKIRNLELNLDANSPYVYYNGSRDLTIQTMVIMAAIKNGDDDETVDKKIKLISYYLDMMSTVRYFNSKTNTYDALRDVAFKLVMDLRDKSFDDLKDVIISKIRMISSSVPEGVKNIKFDKANRKLDLLRFLARVADFLEREMHITNSVGYNVYVNRQLDHKTFDVEHILSDQFATVNAYLNSCGKTIFSTKEEFSKVRNSIGNLILLPRGRNRSLKDAMYNDKIGPYRTENVLAQTLTTEFYTNQPNYHRFLTSHGIELKPYDVMDKDAIKERMDMYEALASKLWSVETAEILFGPAQNYISSVVNDTE